MRTPLCACAAVRRGNDRDFRSGRTFGTATYGKDQSGSAETRNANTEANVGELILGVDLIDVVGIAARAAALAQVVVVTARRQSQVSERTQTDDAEATEQIACDGNAFLGLR